MKMLAVNVGNSRVAFGVFEDGRLTQGERHQLGDNQEQLIEAVQVWGHMSAGSENRAVLASVNPAVDELIRKVLIKEVGMEVLVVGEDVPLPMKVDLPEPAKVGVDRILNAAAAYERIKDAVAVVDAGTAITVDCVSPEGVFLGGAIMPGLGLSARILHEQTSLLPEVKIDKPDWVYGKDTSQAIVAGIYYGALGAVRELVERYASELRAWPTTIVTGGDGELIQAGCGFIQAYVPDLTLIGIELSMRRMQRGAKE